MRQRQRLRDSRIIRSDALRRLQMGSGLLHVAHLEIEEGEPLQRAYVVGSDPQRHVPFVERALEVVLVGEDARVQVVRIREMGVALETGESDAMGGVDLPLVTQQLAQLQEHQAVRVPRQLG